MCQMSFNLDQLTGWYMMGRLVKNIKATKFATFELAILLNLKVNVL